MKKLEKWSVLSFCLSLSLLLSIGTTAFGATNKSTNTSSSSIVIKPDDAGIPGDTDPCTSLGYRREFGPGTHYYTYCGTASKYWDTLCSKESLVTSAENALFTERDNFDKICAANNVNIAGIVEDVGLISAEGVSVYISGGVLMATDVCSDIAVNCYSLSKDIDSLVSTSSAVNSEKAVLKQAGSNVSYAAAVLKGAENVYDTHVSNHNCVGWQR